MPQPAHPLARSLAETVTSVLAQRRADAVAEDEQALAPAPDADAVAAIVDAAFWASLLREEKRSPRISLAFVPPDGVEQPLHLGCPLPLDAAPLARLAPAVERPGIHLGVWREDGELRVWGASITLPDLCLVLEVVEPGLLVAKYRRGEEFGKYGNIAVLRGKQIQIVDEAGASLPDCPALLTTLRGFDAPDSWAGSGNVLVELATSMRGHGRGGSLLVVPEGSDRWRGSIMQPVLYDVSPPFARLAELARQRAPERDQLLSWHDAVRRVVDCIAGLTAVDGAAIMTDRYALLAFGAKIGRRKGCPPIERVVVTEPVVGDAPEVVSIAQLGGTRHLSAAQFVHDQRDALALVASQDGGFTAFAWSPCEGMVHAHRLEVLLL